MTKEELSQDNVKKWQHRLSHCAGCEKPLDDNTIEIDNIWWHYNCYIAPYKITQEQLDGALKALTDPKTGPKSLPDQPIQKDDKT